MRYPKNGIRLGRLALAIVVIVIAVLPLAGPTAAQSGGSYDLSWNTLNSGGTFSSGRPYLLGGTIGQADAGVLTGGSYTLCGGFWMGGAQRGAFRIYLPLVVRAYR